MARISIPKNCSKDVRLCLQELASALDIDKSPTFASVILTDLTATRLVQSDTSKKLSSVSDLTDWIAGTANEINIADDGDGTITIGIVDPLTVAKGGTGTATLVDHSLLVGSGTDAITALGVAINGQLPIGSSGADPVLAALTGTSNQITVTNGAGSITLSTPQDMHTGASPTFADLTLSTPSNIYALSHDSFADSHNLTTDIDHDTITNGGAHDYSYISGNDAATDITAAELEELTDGSETTLHSHAGSGYTSKCLIELSENQNDVPSGAWTTIVLNDVQYDINSEWDAENFKFVAGATGYYLVSISVNIYPGSSDGKYIMIRLRKNDTTSILQAGCFLTTATWAAMLNNTKEIYLTADDELKLQLYHDTGSNKVIAGDPNTFISIRRIG